MTTSADWRPTASIEVLQQRATLLKTIRRFMEERQIMEVDTPALSHAGNSDPNLHSLRTSVHSPARPGPISLYLNTSPEFAMKRLLAAGSGPIYQITRVFRDGEQGRLHQPEFTMLEWYRTAYDHHALMDEMGELLVELGQERPHRHSYASVFEAAVGIDPHRADTAQLQTRAVTLGLHDSGHNRSVLLDFLFERLVIPELGNAAPVLIYDFPVCQAALARIRNDDPPVAERFELFMAGMEIANGFHELADVAEQTKRFEADNHLRRNKGLTEVMPDTQLLAALAHGLPDCAGVAVGIDRLLMAILGYDSIDKVVSFTFNHA